jgi:multimeric flavodoxin WrbA
MAKAAFEGSGVHGRLLEASSVTSADILAARGFLFVCPENLASMSGLMKDMFDRTYYDVLGQIEGRAYATIIAAGSDGEGAQRQIDRIATGWRLRRVAKPMIVNFEAQDAETIWAPKVINGSTKQRCFEMGQALGQGLNEGIF